MSEFDIEALFLTKVQIADGFSVAGTYSADLATAGREIANAATIAAVKGIRDHYAVVASKVCQSVPREITDALKEGGYE